MSRTGHTGPVVDRARTPRNWPTHACPPKFWEELGRTIAAFGFLEDCLKRANLAITATRQYNSVEDAEKAFSTWERDLEKSLDESLGEHTQRFVAALNTDNRFVPDAVTDIERKLRDVADWRNALCHGAWTDYDDERGVATLRHWPRKGWREHSERQISVGDLASVRQETVEITMSVIDAISSNGIQFPGSRGPGAEVLPSSGG